MLACATYGSSAGHAPVRIGEERLLFTAVAFHPDSRTLAAANHRGGITHFDLATGVGTAVPIQWRGGGEYRPYAHAVQLTYSPDGRWLAAAGFDAKVMVWRSEGLVEFRTFGDFFEAMSIAFSPDSRYLAMGNLRGAVRVVDLDEGGATVKELSAEGAVSCLSFREDGDSLVAGTRSGQLHLWGWRPGLRDAVFDATDPVMDCAIRDGDRRLFALAGTSVLAWDLGAPDAPERADLDAPETTAEQLVRYGIVYPAATAALLLLLAASGYGGGSGLPMIPQESAWTRSPMAVSPDGARVVTVVEQPGLRHMYGEGFTQLLDVSTREVIATLAPHASRDLEFSSDGRYVALAGPYGLRVYDTQAARQLYLPNAANGADG